MSGLLYKDYAAVRGKRIVAILAALSAVYIVLRIAFPGTSVGDGALLTNDKGETANLIDLLFFLGEFCILFSGSYYVNRLASKLVEFDEKNKIRSYLMSMPFRKKTYVAAKFAFIGIASALIYGLYLVWHFAGLAFMGNAAPMAANLSKAFFKVSPIFISTVLFFTAIELGLFLILGRARAMRFKIALVMALGIAALAYLLFGDLDVFSNWDLSIITKAMETYRTKVILVSVVVVILAVATFLISMFITSELYEKKEDFDE
ncbi:MAG: ABC-2 transporter permease [Lachnospiraceae bacterium]|nr:ABC-2 transporter permease [Lachnospiraceae bacterium]